MSISYDTSTNMKKVRPHNKGIYDKCVSINNSKNNCSAFDYVIDSNRFMHCEKDSKVCDTFESRRDETLSIMDQRILLERRITGVMPTSYDDKCQFVKDDLMSVQVDTRLMAKDLDSFNREKVFDYDYEKICRKY